MSWAGKLSKKPYLEQYYRTKRWHSQLNNIRKVNDPEDPDIQIDIIYAFFMNCFHLKDWLIGSGIDKNEVYNFMNQHTELLICRDLCNAAKHLYLTKSSTENVFGNGATIHKSYNPYSDSLKNYNFIVNSDNETFEVFELADKCLKLWKGFLEDNKLL